MRSGQFSQPTQIGRAERSQMPDQQRRLKPANQLDVSQRLLSIQLSQTVWKCFDQGFEPRHQNGTFDNFYQIAAGALAIPHLQSLPPRVPAHGQARALAVAIGRTEQRRHPTFRLQAGEVLQLLGKRLLLDL